MGKQIEILNTGCSHGKGREALDHEQGSQECERFAQVADLIMHRYGRSGSGRASGLRLLGAYMILQTEGAPGLRKRGFSRDSIQLYRDKLNEAGVWNK